MDVLLKWGGSLWNGRKNEGSGQLRERGVMPFWAMSAEIATLPGK